MPRPLPLPAQLAVGADDADRAGGDVGFFRQLVQVCLRERHRDLVDGQVGYTIFRVLDFSENLDRVRLLLVNIRYIT
jgi:hypothetical protein